MQSRPINILLVEDNPGDARLVQEMLRTDASAPFHVTQVGRLSELIDALAVGTYDILLLDLGLPDAGCASTDGLLSLQVLNPSLPIVILTGLDDEDFALSAVQRGIQDYLVKGDHTGKHLWASIRYGIERKATELRLARMALYDPVTGLANSTLFLDRLQKAARSVERGMLDGFSLIEIDIDNFATLNLTQGPSTGDNLLKLVAARLEHGVRRTDTVGRLGQSEFGVIVEDIEGDTTQTVLTKFRLPVVLDNQEFQILWSVGLARCPQHGLAAAQLLAHADQEKFRAKQSAATLTLQNIDGPRAGSSKCLAA